MSDENGKNGQDERTKLVKRIQALLEKTTDNGCTEDEAALAAAKVQEMLAQYNLSMEDIKANAETGEVEMDSVLTRTPGYYRTLMHAAAELCFCEYFFTQGVRDAKGSRRTRHNFVGQKQNIIVAQLMGAYFLSSVKRMASESMRNAKCANAVDMAGYDNSFKIAAAMRLYSRVQERIRQAKAGTAVTEGRNLPALLSMYDNAQAANAAFIKLRWPKMRMVPVKIGVKNIKGLLDGRAAGDRISLDTQVGGKSKPAGYIAGK